MLLRTIIAIALLGVTARADVPTGMPEEFIRASQSIRGEKSRAKRLGLLREFQDLVRKRKAELPDDVPEDQLPAGLVLYELDLFLGKLTADAVTPAKCAQTMNWIEVWSNPSREGAPNPTGRFVLEIVQAVCAQ
jgi:hypothetical protein